MFNPEVFISFFVALPGFGPARTTWMLGLSTCLLFGCIAPEPSEAEEAAQSFTQDLLQILEDEALMGMAVAVIEGGQVVYAQGLGWADRERKVPVGASTPFRVASISKSITATALMQLAEAGAVDLDADVNRYLDFKLRHPGFPDSPITLRMLLSHRSSIRDGEAYRAFQRAGTANPIRALFSPEGAYYDADLFLPHRPGTYFTYANCTWGIIASVIERVSGERFDAYCRRHLFEPLGMRADFNPRRLRRLDSLAVLYRGKDSKWVAQADDYKGEIPPSRVPSDYVPGQAGLLFGPQGSLRASALDLCRFALAHMQGGALQGARILRPASVAEMHAPQWSFNGQNGDTYHDLFFAWGLGFHLITRRDSADIVFDHQDMIGHPGEAYGLISDMYFDADRQRGIVFLTNGSLHPYAYGRHSAFYRPEEAVFQAAQRFLSASKPTIAPN